MLLKTAQNAKRVRDEIATELGGVWSAGGLLFGGPLQKAAGRRACRFFVISRKRCADNDLNESEDSADLWIHCHMP